jgi:hypothetical protein
MRSDHLKSVGPFRTGSTGRRGHRPAAFSFEGAWCLRRGMAEAIIPRAFGSRPLGLPRVGGPAQVSCLSLFSLHKHSLFRNLHYG